MIRLLLLLLLTGCAWAPRNPHYRESYSHLRTKPTTPRVVHEVPYSLTVLVNARHLDYSDGRALLRTLVKHPSDGSLSGDVGHAWILLLGEEGVLQGGHTGEFGLLEAKYFDGIMDLVEVGDPNPVRYLWKTLRDGRFEEGSGGHTPTYAVRFSITREEYESLRAKILSSDLTDYSLQGKQCVTFVEELLARIGIELDCRVEVPFPMTVVVGKSRIPVYSDPCYSKAVFASPDLLERELMELVREGRGEYALDWVDKNYPSEKSGVAWGDLPFRAGKVWLMR